MGSYPELVSSSLTLRASSAKHVDGGAGILFPHSQGFRGDSSPFASLSGCSGSTGPDTFSRLHVSCSVISLSPYPAFYEHAKKRTIHL